MTSLSPSDESWLVGADEGTFRASTVVVATGGENMPRTPRISRHLTGQVVQLHAAEYRNPDQLPDGAVLVVGSAQSGYQIAEDLLAAGRTGAVASDDARRHDRCRAGGSGVVSPTRVWPVRNVPLPEPHLLAMAAGIWLHRAHPLVLPGSRYMHQLIGWSLIATGIEIVARSIAAASTTHLDRPDRLVTAGLHGVSRNPMYLGWALPHVGAGVACGSRWVLATVPLALGLVHREARRVERTLAEAFAVEFERYRAAAPRYVPRPTAATAPEPLGPSNHVTQ